jgi:TrmH family RNA methyltransferase
LEGLSVVLVEPRNPLNIGAAARAMANFGFTDLRLVNAYRVAADEARSGPNADEVLKASRDFDSIPAAIADATLVIGTSSARKRDMRLDIKRLETAGLEIRQHLQHGRVAILFGSEKFGLSNEDLGYCHYLTRIPTGGSIHSMNLGQAVAVTLYELIREVPERLPAAPEDTPANAGLLDTFTGLLNTALEISGYVHTEHVDQKVRRLIRRMHLRAPDAVMWIGILRQILWKLRKESDNHDPSRD